MFPSDQVDLVLRDAYDWLSGGEHRWTRGVMYRDANGNSPYDYTFPTWDPAGDAVHSTCLSGAIARTRILRQFGYGTERDAIERLALEIDGALSAAALRVPDGVVTAFNDDKGTTYEDVLVTLKRAIG